MKKNYGKMLAAALSMVCLTGLLMVGGALAETAEGLKVMEKADLGKYLTDAKGMTLYTFDKDTPSQSACTGDCLVNWPAFYVSEEEGEGWEPGALGTITREDGKQQSAYKGKPLYYFIKDTKAGDTNGQGVKKVWWVAKP